ncbi:MAG TPA: hypothetical protein VGE66_00540 [Chitinophagaceae bacterium]
MSRNPPSVSTTGLLALASVLLNTIILRSAFTQSPQWYGALLLTLPAMGLALVQLARARRNL